MTTTRPEVALVNLIWFGAWGVGVLLLVIFGRRAGTRVAAFRARVVVQWRPALALAALTLLGLLARDVAVGANLPRALVGDLLLPVGVFAQALIGLALARGISKFEPLPLSAPAAPRQHVVRTLVLTTLITVIAAPVGLVLGSLGTSLGAGLAHETVRSQAVTSQFPANPVLAFLLLLAGAGIAEEVVYRLVILSLVWRLTGSPWAAVVVAAVLHGFYHLTPLNGFYAQFWQYPVAQVVGTIGISVVWGILYVKRGLESAIVGHTLSDWIGLTFLLR
jgi:membrane protease YdiL (CAAX protease family)